MGWDELDRVLNYFILESRHIEECLSDWMSVGFLCTNSRKNQLGNTAPNRKWDTQAGADYDTQMYVWEHDFVPNSVSPNLFSSSRPSEITFQFYKKRAKSAIFFIKTLLYYTASQDNLVLSPCHVICCKTQEEFSSTGMGTFQGHHPLIKVRNCIELKHGSLGILEFHVTWIQYHCAGYQQTAPQLWWPHWISQVTKEVGNNKRSKQQKRAQQWSCDTWRNCTPGMCE